jgi:hypothetical protein
MSSVTKYQQYFQQMLEQHPMLFASFKQIHDKYAQDPETWQEQYNEQGKDVLEVIREYISMLCAKSEGGQYGKFATNLEDKFWQAVRTQYPKIDFVGVEID